MKYRATRTFGKYRAGETYEIGRPRLEDRSAIRTGLLVAANGWCAPSEALYDCPSVFSIPCPQFDTAEGILSLPEIVKEQAEKPKRARKKPAVPLTLEEIAKASGEAMDGLRG